jgi:hypothetical protein
VSWLHEKRSGKGGQKNTGMRYFSKKQNRPAIAGLLAFPDKILFSDKDDIVIGILPEGDCFEQLQKMGRLRIGCFLRDDIDDLKMSGFCVAVLQNAGVPVSVDGTDAIAIDEVLRGKAHRENRWHGAGGISLCRRKAVLVYRPFDSFHQCFGQYGAVSFQCDCGLRKDNSRDGQLNLHREGCIYPDEKITELVITIRKRNFPQQLPLP